MQEITLYIQKGCSKSGEAERLLRENGYDPTVIDMATDPPSPQKLIELSRKMGLPLSKLLRPGSDLPVADTDPLVLAEAMSASPRSIERPIAETADSAIVARPPETVLTFIK